MEAAAGIVAAMLKVMGDVGAIGKNRKAPGLNYAFRGIDDILPELQPLFVKHGVLVTPRVLERERETVLTRGGSPMISVRLLVEHTFKALDGSSVVATTLGEAMDTGDKASNKAMTAALKAALWESFSIPTHEADRDTEEHSPEIAAPPKAKPPAKTSPVAVPRTESGRAATFAAPSNTSTQLPADAQAALGEAADEVMKEMASLCMAAAKATAPGQVDALRPRYNALQKVMPAAEWTALGEELKARKAELMKGAA